MRIALSTPGKFHTFDLARELHAHGVLSAVYSGYPRFKLGKEGLPSALIHTFPWVKGPLMANPWGHRIPPSWMRQWQHWAATSFGKYVARNIQPCDVYVGLSGSSLDAGKKIQVHGGRYVCDRGSAHIRTQDYLLREEHARWDMPFSGIDSRAIDTEETEYAQADLITVPSTFARHSFIEHGLPANKLRLLSYGVNLSRFQPVDKPATNCFDVLFVGGMSLQKGVQYLIQAFQKINHAAKTLTFVGVPSPDLIAMFRNRGMWPLNTRVLGHVPQVELKKIMSRSHVLVLPSIQEGMAMVMAQAMACGCPIIASRNTGAEDLFVDSQQGYIVPIRDVNALTERMQRLAERPHEREEMGRKALILTQKIGGWHEYGQNALAIYRSLTSRLESEG